MKTKLLLILQWSGMVLIMALAAYGATWLLAQTASLLVAHWPAIRAALSHAAFWSIVILIARVIFHLGSCLARKAATK